MKKICVLVIFCSLLLTACGNTDKSNSQYDARNISITSTIETQKSTEYVANKSENVFDTKAESTLSENSCSEMLGLQWGDNVDTVKLAMTDYISTYEESYENDTSGEFVTFLAYMDIEFMGELCDINFQFVDGKLTQISYSYIWNESKIKSDGAWFDTISEQYGEADSESKWYLDENTVVSMTVDRIGIYINYISCDYDTYSNDNVISESDSVEQSMPSENKSSNNSEEQFVIDEKGRKFYNKTAEEFILRFNELDTELDIDFEISHFHEGIPETFDFADKYYIDCLYDEWSFMNDNPVVIILINTNEDGLIEEVKIEMAGLYCSDKRIDIPEVFAAVDAALNDISIENAREICSVASKNNGVFFEGNNGAVYLYEVITSYCTSENTILNLPDNKNAYYSYAILT
ncbi:hypothetical protein [Porcipelethomonas sp.]|uniref:hypothetical protein n=1 Tax=Porcipelethomonas sp. TaxID=2981675 RepID=UPI003EF940BF